MSFLEEFGNQMADQLDAGVLAMVKDEHPATVTESIRFCTCGASEKCFRREVVNDGVCPDCGHLDEDAIEYGDEICTACGTRNPETTSKSVTRPWDERDYWNRELLEQYKASLTLTGIKPEGEAGDELFMWGGIRPANVWFNLLPLIRYCDQDFDLMDRKALGLWPEVDVDDYQAWCGEHAHEITMARIEGHMRAWFDGLELSCIDFRFLPLICHEDCDAERFMALKSFEVGE